ncbi:MAG: ATP cone domain-containing protein [Clostridiaceae bacterium]
MEVIKKSGHVQELDISKIETSIKNAAEDISFNLNESDIKCLVKDILNRIKFIRKDGSSTSSYEIQAIIIEKLVQDGFSQIADSFISYKKQ